MSVDQDKFVGFKVFIRSMSTYAMQIVLSNTSYRCLRTNKLVIRNGIWFPGRWSGSRCFIMRS